MSDPDSYAGEFERLNELFLEMPSLEECDPISVAQLKEENKRLREALKFYEALGND